MHGQEEECDVKQYLPREVKSKGEWKGLSFKKKSRSSNGWVRAEFGKWSISSPLQIGIACKEFQHQISIFKGC